MKEGDIYIIPEDIEAATFIVGETDKTITPKGLDISDADTRFQGDQSHGDTLFGMGVIKSIIKSGKNAVLVLNREDFENERE